MVSKFTRAREAASDACPLPTARPASLRILTRNLLAVLFMLAAASCLFGQFAVVREVFAGRAPGVSKRPAVRWAEIAWVLIPAAGLLAVLIATWLRVSAVPEVASLGLAS